jgi:hypothetical protein
LSARTLNCLSASTLDCLSARTLNGLPASTLKKVKDLRKKAKWEKPYTALLEAIKRPAALDMSNWHSCETTHCIGGWITTLAPNGKELEQLLGMPEAPKFILQVNRPGAPLPRFDANAPADAIMAFVEARAEEEK